MNIVLGVSHAYSWERVISYKYFFGTGLGTSRVNLGALHLSFLCLRVACFLCDGTYLLLARALETISGPMRLGEHQCASINFFFPTDVAYIRAQGKHKPMIFNHQPSTIVLPSAAFGL